VRRVRDHDVGLGDGGHHASARRLHLPALDRLADLGRRGVLLLLVLDLLLVHPHLLLEAPLLVDDVGDRDHEVGGCGALGDVEHRVREHRYEVARRHAHERGELLELGQDREDRDGGHDQDLAHVLRALEQNVRAEQVLRAGERVHLPRVRLDRLAHDPGADLHDVGEHAGERADGRDRADGHEDGLPSLHGQLAEHRSVDAARVRRHRDRRAHRVADLLQHVRPPDGEGGEAADEHDGAVEVLGLGDLPLLARLCQALGSCLLGLFAAACHVTPYAI
jgi:hypothetical protein